MEPLPARAKAVSNNETSRLHLTFTSGNASVGRANSVQT